MLCRFKSLAVDNKRRFLEILTVLHLHLYQFLNREVNLKTKIIRKNIYFIFPFYFTNNQIKFNTIAEMNHRRRKIWTMCIVTCVYGIHRVCTWRTRNDQTQL